jgi:hypothetical protein
MIVHTLGFHTVSPNNNVNIIMLFYNFCRGHPALFNELQDKQIVYGCRQTQQYIYFFYFLILMATCFGHPDNYLAILLEINLKYMQCILCSMRSHNTYNYVKIRVYTKY